MKFDPIFTGVDDEGTITATKKKKLYADWKSVKLLQCTKKSHRRNAEPTEHSPRLGDCNKISLEKTFSVHFLGVAKFYNFLVDFII